MDQIVIALTENQVEWIRNKIADSINDNLTDRQREFLVTLDDQFEQSLMDMWDKQGEDE